MTPSPIFRRITDQILENTNMLSLVGERVKLRRVGKEWVGLCPFHNNTRTGSFYVNPEKRAYKCFSCGAGGDAFTFLMQADGDSFLTVREYLANRAGISLTPLSRDEYRLQQAQEAYARQLAEEAAFWWGWVTKRYEAEFRRYMNAAIWYGEREEADPLCRRLAQDRARHAGRWGRILRRLQARSDAWAIEQYRRVRGRAMVRAVVAEERDKTGWGARLLAAARTGDKVAAAIDLAGWVMAGEGEVWPA